MGRRPTPRITRAQLPGSPKKELKLEETVTSQFAVEYSLCLKPADSEDELMQALADLDESKRNAILRAMQIALDERAKAEALYWQEVCESKRSSGSEDDDDDDDDDDVAILDCDATAGNLVTPGDSWRKKRKRRKKKKAKKAALLCHLKLQEQLDSAKKKGDRLAFFHVLEQAAPFENDKVKAESKSWFKRARMTFNAVNCCLEKCYGGKKAAWWEICDGKLTMSKWGCKNGCMLAAGKKNDTI